MVRDDGCEMLLDSTAHIDPLPSNQEEEEAGEELQMDSWPNIDENAMVSTSL